MAKLFRTSTLGLSIAMLMAQTVPSLAQSLLDAAPAISRTAPSESESILSTRVAPAEDVPAARPEGLVPFEQALPAYRLQGEDDVVRLTFNLAPEQISAGGQLALSYKNAVSVLPDTSVMDIRVNGKPAGSFQIAAPNGFKTETVKVDASYLKPGRNEVRIRARQFHRVDCSLEATYELWSEIDPNASGFVAAKTIGFSSFGDLLTVGRNEAGVTDVHLILPRTATAEMLNDAAPALQTLALFLDRNDLAVSVSDKPGTGPGIDLYVSTDKTRAQMQDASANGQAMPYGLSVKDGAEPGRATLGLRGATRAEMSGLLLEAIRGPLKESLDSGIFSKRAGTIVASGSSSFTLADTGYETRVFSGRLSRTRFDMVMPADFYPGDYATIGVKLHAATSPGLKYTAQLLVRVNDLVVTSYPFRNAGGDQFDGKLIELPLRAFRPGVNKVELLAEVPVESDAVCAVTSRDDTKPRFILLQETAIEIPALARIGRLPDIGALAGTAYPYSDGKPFDIFVERPDGQSAGAALTMLSRLALSARAPLNAEIRLGAATATAGRNALVVSTADAFSQIGDAGKGSFPPQDSSASAFTAAPAGSDPFATAAISATSNNGTESGALLDAFRKSTTQPEGALSVLSRAQTWLATAGTRFGKWLNYDGETSASATLRPGQSLLTLTQLQAPSGDAVWTVVQAQSPNDMALGMHRLVDPAVWNTLSGGSAEIETAACPSRPCRRAAISSPAWKTRVRQTSAALQQPGLPIISRSMSCSSSLRWEFSPYGSDAPFRARV